MSGVPGTFITVGQTLSDEVRGMVLAARRGGFLSETLAAARERGWTLTALAEPLGITRQAIKQRVSKAVRAEVADLARSMPEAPRWPQPEAAPRSREVPQAVAVELRQQWQMASTVRGYMPLDDPRRELSIKFSARLADLRAAGYSVRALARACACNPNTIKFRLGRHGHAQLPPSLAGQEYRNARAGAKKQPLCGRGHRMEGDNLGFDRRGYRWCRACRRARYQETKTAGVR